METSVTLGQRSFLFEYPLSDACFPDAYTAFIRERPADEESLGHYHLVPQGEIRPDIGDKLWEGPTWRMRRDEAHFYVDLHDVQTDSWIPTAQFNSDFSEGCIHPIAGRIPSPSRYLLNYPTDQILFINRLPRTGVVLLHAAGVWFEDKIYLFCGRSDIGKTTLARLFRDQGATLLNDDRMFIWASEQKVLASPSPWHGEDPEINLRIGEVKGIFHLGQSDDHSLRSLQGIESVSALTATAVLPFYLEESIAPGLEVLHHCADRVPSFRFHFRPDHTAVSFLVNQQAKI